MHKLVLAGILLSGTAAGADDARTLSWLAGCWQSHADGRLIEEHWLAPRAGGLIGVSRTTNGDDLVEYEFLRIAGVNDRLVYFANPSGQSATEFGATRISAEEAIFRNPSHDFPQQVRYQRLNGKQLRAEISGPGRDGQRTIGWTLKRVKCPGAP